MVEEYIPFVSVNADYFQSHKELRRYLHYKWLKNLKFMLLPFYHLWKIDIIHLFVQVCFYLQVSYLVHYFRILIEFIFQILSKILILEMSGVNSLYLALVRFDDITNFHNFVERLSFKLSESDLEGFSVDFQWYHLGFDVKYHYRLDFPNFLIFKCFDYLVNETNLMKYLDFLNFLKVKVY